MKRPGGTSKAAGKRSKTEPDPEPERTLRPGPQTLQEGFQWPLEMLKVVCESEERTQRLMNSINKMWRVSSDYSGLRAEEVAFAALAGAIQETLGAELRHDFSYSCDIDTMCQSLTLGTTPGRKPKHCFKDLNGWLTPAAAEHLDWLESSGPPLPADASKETKKQILDERTQRYQSMGEWLLATDVAVDNKSDCLEHMRPCELDFGDPPPGEERLSVAGLTCVAWSAMGQHEGFAHQSMRPFYIWAAHTRKLQPCILVLESAKRFPQDLLQNTLQDLYHLVFIDHAGPVFHGWPISRPRMYCLGFLRKKVTFMGSADEYYSLFERSLQLQGDDLFFLPMDSPEVQKEKWPWLKPGMSARSWQVELGTVSSHQTSRP